MNGTVAPGSRLATGAVALVVVAMNCTPLHVPATPAQRALATNDASSLCEMVATALRETVRTYEEQPLGLERACVAKLASPQGTVYVDVNFSGTAYQGKAEGSQCVRDNYAIRFDYRIVGVAPTSYVILFLVFDDSLGARKFNARVETADWFRQKPGVMTLSQCGSAFGVIEKISAGWHATVTAPPRSPDAL